MGGPPPDSVWILERFDVTPQGGFGVRGRRNPPRTPFLSLHPRPSSPGRRLQAGDVGVEKAADGKPPATCRRAFAVSPTRSPNAAGRGRTCPSRGYRALHRAVRKHPGQGSEPRAGSRSRVQAARRPAARAAGARRRARRARETHVGHGNSPGAPAHGQYPPRRQRTAHGTAEPAPGPRPGSARAPRPELKAPVWGGERLTGRAGARGEGGAPALESASGAELRLRLHQDRGSRRGRRRMLTAERARL